MLLGAAIGTTIMGGLRTYPLVVPRPTVLAVGVGVPALGVLVVGLVHPVPAAAGPPADLKRGCGPAPTAGSRAGPAGWGSS